MLLLLVSIIIKSSTTITTNVMFPDQVFTNNNQRDRLIDQRHSTSHVTKTLSTQWYSTQVKNDSNLRALTASIMEQAHKQSSGQDPTLTTKVQ